jgi:hypothetical protein
MELFPLGSVSTEYDVCWPALDGLRNVLLSIFQRNHKGHPGEKVAFISANEGGPVKFFHRIASYSRERCLRRIGHDLFSPVFLEV